MRLSIFSLVLGFGLAAPALGTPSSDKDRVPVSSGEYQIRLGGKRIGEERFQIFKDKGYRVETTRTLYWPEPTRQEIRYELEPTLEPKKLGLVSTRGGIVTELKLERSGENWRTEVKGQGRDRKKHELGRRAGTVVDFDSLVFNGLALRRLALGPGETRSVDAIALALPDLFGERLKQSYRRLEDEEIETEYGAKVTAAVYELSTAAAKHRLWVAPSGVVVRGVFESVGAEKEVVLLSLETRPGAWPP